jgi:hypothetical protein
MRKEVRSTPFIKRSNLAFLFFDRKNKCAKLGIAKNGFIKTEKSGGKQIIKNTFHFTTNVTMKPCSNVTMI